MRYLAIGFYSFFIFSSCSTKENRIDKEKEEFKLVEIDSYSFRRAYHGHDTLKGNDLEVFMNRNPEPNEEYSNSSNHKLYAQLKEIGLIQDGNLNIRSLDTLSDQFTYQESQKNTFNVKTRLLENPDEIKTPSYELTFKDNSKVVLVDTLEFGWPPDVIFIKNDINGDGTEEIISIYKWYIINGDNFDVKIYELTQLPKGRKLKN